MRKLLTACAVLFACLFAMTPAEARPHARHKIVQPELCIVFCGVATFAPGAVQSSDWRNDARRHGNYGALGPRPGRWCGWFMRKLTGIMDPKLNLARNWARVGTNAGGPAPGVIGVWRGHVVKVIEVLPGNRILAVSGNDGHAVKTRVRSAAGAIAWRRV